MENRIKYSQKDDCFCLDTCFDPDTENEALAYELNEHLADTVKGFVKMGKSLDGNGVEISMADARIGSISKTIEGDPHIEDDGIARHTTVITLYRCYDIL